MFFQKPDPDADPYPDDEREWRSEADCIRRTNAELERVRRTMTTYVLMAKVWESIMAGWQHDRNRMQWVDEPTGKIIKP